MEPELMYAPPPPQDPMGNAQAMFPGQPSQRLPYPRGLLPPSLLAPRNTAATRQNYPSNYGSLPPQNYGGNNRGMPQTYGSQMPAGRNAHGMQMRDTMNQVMPGLYQEPEAAF